MTDSVDGLLRGCFSYGVTRDCCVRTDAQPPARTKQCTLGWAEQHGRSSHHPCVLFSQESGDVATIMSILSTYAKCFLFLASVNQSKLCEVPV